jgi:uncharacterized protein
MSTMEAIFSQAKERNFQNLSESGLSLADVYLRILRFIREDPRAVYHFVIGTDSQVFRKHTKFVTGVVIYRQGKGAWACYRHIAVPRAITSIREKLALETSFSEKVADYFDPETIGRMEDILLPFAYQGASLRTYIDIDAGTVPVVNETALYVQEMMSRVEATGMYVPRVKPEAYAASCYANRFTKKP